MRQHSSRRVGVTPKSKVRLGISACLLGKHVRYDGLPKKNILFAGALSKLITWVPVCPEVECGLAVPREPSLVVCDDRTLRLVGRESHIDHTSRLIRGAHKSIRNLGASNLEGFIFKSRSPSCAIHDSPHYDTSNRVIKYGAGLFAELIIRKFPMLPVEDERRLHDTSVRDSFIERLFCLRRWREFLDTDGSFEGLRQFHHRNLFILKTRRARERQAMCRMIEEGPTRTRHALLKEYGRLLDTTLRKPATPSHHADSMTTVLKKLGKVLRNYERIEMESALRKYRKGTNTLSAVRKVFAKYLRRHGSEDLNTQWYFHPPEEEARLRWHAEAFSRPASRHPRESKRPSHM